MPTLNPPLISALAAAALIILQVGLMGGVIYLRRTRRQSLGHGDVPGLEAAIRRHGNLAENAALFLVGLALLELLGAPRLRVEIVASVFIAARLSHAIGLSLPKTANIFRTLGIVGTVVAFVSLTVGLVRLGAAAF